MATNMLVLALCAVAVMGGAIPEAARYPAGVDPNICPNYPNCDNVALAAHTLATAPSPYHSHSSYPSNPSYSAPAPYAAPAYSAYGHQSGAGVPRAAAAYPAGVDANVCPNYPYCGPTPAHAPAAPSYNSWNAHAAPNSWNAPAHQNNRVDQGSLSNIGGPNFWSNPAGNSFANSPSQSSWNAGAGRNSWNAPAPTSDLGGALFPAGVDPSSCPNYPYCN